MVSAWVVSGMGSPVRADPAPPPQVNLLTKVSTVVAVSSTVANKAIVPAHLVDGDPTTAWNSRTGQLVGAWLAVRIPAGATVSSIKLTVGYTKQDPKLGDLFTENPRIKRVRVTHGTTQVDKTLDIANRKLQEIAISGGSGDYRIEVLEVEPGTKKDWKEVCVSELEVWGTLSTPAPGHVSPVVRVGSLDPPPPLTDEECGQVGYANVSSTAIVLDQRYAVCDLVSATNPHDPFDTQNHDIALVSLRTKQAIGERVATLEQKYEGRGSATDTTLAIESLILGTNEVGILVTLASSPWSNLPDDGPPPPPSTTYTVYRATAKGLVSIFEIRGAPGCSIASGATAPQLDDLDMTCENATKHFRWNGKRFVAKP